MSRDLRFVAVVDENRIVIGVRESARRVYTHAIVANRAIDGGRDTLTNAVVSFHSSEANAATAARGLNTAGTVYRWTEIRVVPVIETARRAKVGQPIAAALVEPAPRDGFNNKHED